MKHTTHVLIIYTFEICFLVHTGGEVCTVFRERRINIYHLVGSENRSDVKLRVETNT